MQRRATTAVALMFGMSAAPDLLQSQSRGVPSADTPRLLVAVFASNDRASGVQAADAIRTRVTNATSVRQLYVIPKSDITNYLESSGYRADSSLGPTDLRELAKLLRADEVLGGTATITPGGMKIEPRLMLARDVTIAQPLPAVEARNANDAARQIERALGEARRQLEDNKNCENAIRDQQFDKAIAAARKAITAYPGATIARTCLAMAFQTMETTADSAKSSPDSILKVTDEIKRLDPKNSFALRLAFSAQQQKGDSIGAVRSLVSLLALEPTNLTLQGQVINELAKLRQPEIALPIVDTLLAQSPGDPVLLRQRWLLTLQAAAADTGAARAAWFDKSLRAGVEMARADSTTADSTYFERQILAATGSTMPARAVEFAAAAVQRFPNSAHFWALKGNAERKANQLPTARASFARTLSIDPKYPNANLLLAQTFVDLNQPDSAVVVARRAVSLGEDPKTWGAFLLAPTQAVVKQAQATDSVVYWERGLALAQEADRLSPSAASKFLVGVSSFQVGIDAIRVASAAQQGRRPDRPRICTNARRAQEMFLLTQTNMPGGGSIDPNTARQVLGFVTQYAPAADQMAEQSCK